MQTVEVFEKEDAKLEAILSKGAVKKEANWSFKEAKLVTSIRYNQECDRDLMKHRMIIRDCTLEDAGEYTFTVRKNSAKVLLLVKGYLFV